MAEKIKTDVDRRLLLAQKIKKVQIQQNLLEIFFHFQNQK